MVHNDYMRILDPIPLPVNGQFITGPAPDPEPGPPYNQLRIRNVTVPTLTPVLPDEPCGAAVIICPGGGWHKLSVESEGTWVAERLAARGMASFVLHYRLEPSPRGPEGEGWEAFDRKLAQSGGLEELASNWLAPNIADGAAAATLVRSRASEWNVDSNRIGFMGFSAGGQVALATALRSPESAAAFVVGVYPAFPPGLGAVPGVPPL